MKLRFLLMAILCSILFSCEKEVDLNLEDAEPRLVIDASFGFLQPCYVKLSLTRSYWDQNSAQRVSRAEITIVNEEGDKDELVELEEGLYTSRIVGQIGQTYTLIVEVNGKSYQATETIPTFVPIDKVSIYKMDTGGDMHYYPQISFKDPKGEPNYYYYAISINGKRMQQIKVDSDKNSEGLIKETILPFDKDENNDEKLKIGDEVYIEMQTIGEGAYTFYKTISSPGAMPNSNPQSNFSGDVLGMFKTYNTSYINMTVKEEDILK